VPVVDGLMAATALVNNWTLVTRNVGHIRSTGVRLRNPFSR
jgi:predicted nucleic acid-binding protein